MLVRRVRGDDDLVGILGKPHEANALGDGDPRIGTEGVIAVREPDRIVIIRGGDRVLERIGGGDVTVALGDGDAFLHGKLRRGGGSPDREITVGLVNVAYGLRQRRHRTAVSELDENRNVIAHSGLHDTEADRITLMAAVRRRIKLERRTRRDILVAAEVDRPLAKQCHAIEVGVVRETRRVALIDRRCRRGLEMVVRERRVDEAGITRIAADDIIGGNLIGARPRIRRDIDDGVDELAVLTRNRHRVFRRLIGTPRNRAVAQHGGFGVVCIIIAENDDGAALLGLRCIRGDVVDEALFGKPLTHPKRAGMHVPRIDIMNNRPANDGVSTVKCHTGTIIVPVGCPVITRILDIAEFAVLHDAVGL